MSQTLHFLFDMTALSPELSNIIRAFLQHRSFAEFGIWILTQLRNETVKGIESVFDVVPPLLLRVNVSYSPLLFVPALAFPLDEEPGTR